MTSSVDYILVITLNKQYIYKFDVILTVHLR